MGNATSRFDYDTSRMAEDMVLKGWSEAALARAANLPRVRIGRFFNGAHQTPATAKAIADALEQPLERYLLRVARPDEAVSA